MAFVQTIPDSKQLSMNWSVSNADGGGPDVKYVPKDTGGTVYDASTVSALSMNVAAPLLANPANAINCAPTISFADATGVVVNIDSAALALIMAGLQGASAKYEITATVGTSTLLLGVGNIGVTLLP